jgi:hypothetical protein
MRDSLDSGAEPVWSTGQHVPLLAHTAANRSAFDRDFLPGRMDDLYAGAGPGLRPCDSPRRTGRVTGQQASQACRATRRFVISPGFGRQEFEGRFPGLIPSRTAVTGCPCQRRRARRSRLPCGDGRPATALDRSVFIRIKAPHHCLTPGGVRPWPRPRGEPGRARYTRTGYGTAPPRRCSPRTPRWLRSARCSGTGGPRPQRPAPAPGNCISRGRAGLEGVEPVLLRTSTIAQVQNVLPRRPGRAVPCPGAGGRGRVISLCWAASRARAWPRKPASPVIVAPDWARLACAGAGGDCRCGRGPSVAGGLFSGRTAEHGCLCRVRLVDAGCRGHGADDRAAHELAVPSPAARPLIRPADSAGGNAARASMANALVSAATSLSRLMKAIAL